MAGTVVDDFNLYRDSEAEHVSYLWDVWNGQRATKVAQWTELRNFLFATDTSTTSTSGLPWKNSTTTPKLCQIRDNLHANYIETLIPNSRWMKWESATMEDDTIEKAKAITSYMTTKFDESKMFNTLSQLLYDFIDYGNCFAEVEYVRDVHRDDVNNEVIVTYEGPKARRISPLDIVFNPLAPSFDESPKILRKLYTKGEILQMANRPDGECWAEAIEKHDLLRKEVSAYTKEDSQKAIAYSVDGFGSFTEYLNSGFIEVLDFRGDYFDGVAVHSNLQILVIGRSILVAKRPIPNWLGKTAVVHAGWRYRPDNLWAMGPLDNLVGMQYRIDHLENLKADAMDLAVLPMLKIKGDVDPFVWQPGGEINIIGDGDVEEFGKSLQPLIMTDNAIALYENKMEEYAGAPKQAMGIRTPGEKTAYEVQRLENAAGRIFQEKVRLFEVNLLEPLLNLMLECAARNLAGADVIRSFDEDFGVEMLMEITKDDITSKGKIRPIGARHFGEQAQLIQNVTGLFNSPIGQMLQPHLSLKNLAYMIEDVLQLQRYELIRPNIGQVEQAENAQMAGNLEQSVMEQQAVGY